jgi:hypothetical protein
VDHIAKLPHSALARTLEPGPLLVRVYRFPRWRRRTTVVRDGEAALARPTPLRHRNQSQFP